MKVRTRILSISCYIAITSFCSAAVIFFIGAPIVYYFEPSIPIYVTILCGMIAVPIAFAFAAGCVHLIKIVADEIK